MTEFIVDSRIVGFNESARFPDSFGLRGSYIGKTGAENWLDVAREATYPQNGSFFDLLLSTRASMLANLRFSTFVSLGPGDGQLDLTLIKRHDADPEIESKNRCRYYIPVDISPVSYTHLTLPTKA